MQGEEAARNHPGFDADQCPGLGPGHCAGIRGGSLEDLWAFNEEAVAEAVFCSRLPVLAGIGHEVDVTLADLTADLRAATPSHAAQLLWPLRAELRQRLDEAFAALRRAAAGRLERAELLLRERENALRWFSPARHQARLSEQVTRFSLAFCNALPGNGSRTRAAPGNALNWPAGPR